MTNGLTNSGIPLGGLGTGSVEIRSDGYFHEWQIANNGPWGGGPELNAPRDTMFFAMQVHGAGVERSLVLGTACERNTWLNDLYHAPWIEHPATIKPTVQFPFTTLEYEFAGVPLDIRLDAYSPFIPHDHEDSGLPLAYFRFTIKNRSRKLLRLSLAAALRNLCGYADPQRLSGIQSISSASSARLLFSRDHCGASNDTGTMALGALPCKGVRFSHLAHPRNSRDLWEALRETGSLENADLGDFSGEMGNVGDSWQARLRQGLPHGILCQTVALPALRETTLTFALTWHFPHFIDRGYTHRGIAPTEIGHRYAARFADAGQVLDYATRNLKQLTARTTAFSTAYHEGNLPGWLRDAVAAQLTTLVKSSWWDLRGRFGIWEGLGCCGLQTTDITHYGSFPIVLLFPEIQKSQMRLTRDNIESKGKIPHMMPGTFACGDLDERGRIDLIPQFVLLVWRDVLWTGDLDYAREMWQTVVDGLELFTTFDTDGDGLPNNNGPDQTYDQFPLKGTSSFVGFLYAAALDAAAQLADMLGHIDSADSYRSEFETAMVALDKQLWNGSWYRLSYDSATRTANEGVMADQINADWFMRQTTGAGLLPLTRVQSALRSVLRYCTSPHGFVANCAWPKGGAVTIGRHTADQANWPWTGVEYALAAHLVLAGLAPEGLTVTRNVWERHERSGARFNHIECGEHYYRALSSWAIYLAVQGFSFDARAEHLAVACYPKQTSTLMATPSSWGALTTACRTKLFDLRLTGGVLRLRSLLLRNCKAGPVRVVCNRRVIAGTATACAEGARIIFPRTITIRAGGHLQVLCGRGRA